MACQPETGSESKFGWDAVNAISDFADCHVLTHEMSRAKVDEYLDRQGVSSLTFHYVGSTFRWHPNRLLARLQSWVAYARWQQAMLASAMSLHDSLRFDLAHHVTYATWRIPSPLWRLPIPFVWGPVGGGTNMSRSYYSILSRQAQLFEEVRRISGAISTRRNEFRSCVNRASALVAAEKDTADFLGQYRRRDRATVLCPAFFSQSQMLSLSASDKPSSSTLVPLRIFGGGNLEGRKGVALALRAISILKAKGIRTTYALGGSGPERTHLEQLATQLGVRDDVLFSQGFSGDEYRQRLAETDVYLLPSLRETAGITMMEAMLAGCYPIVLAGTGAGDIVERAGTPPLSARDPDDAVARIVERLEWCHHHRSELLHRAQNAALMIRILYSKEAYQTAIKAIYGKSIEECRSVS